MKMAYFVGGCLGAIAFSNFLKLAARITPALNAPVLIFLGVIVAIALAVAMFWDDVEEALTAWFIGICAIGLGVMLGAI